MNNMNVSPFHQEMVTAGLFPGCPGVFNLQNTFPGTSYLSPTERERIQCFQGVVIGSLKIHLRIRALLGWYSQLVIPIASMGPVYLPTNFTIKINQS